MTKIASVSVRSPNGSSPVDSATRDTTGALSLIAIMTCESATFPGMSDSKGNAWQPRTPQTIGGRRIKIFDCVGLPTVGTGHYFTIGALAGSYPSLVVLAFDTVNQFDVENGATHSSGTTLQPGTLTPSHALSLVITAMQNVGTFNFMSVDSGFTLEFDLTEGAFADALAVGWKSKASATAENPTWTLTASAAAEAVIASYIVATPPPIEARVTQQVVEYVTGPPSREASFHDGEVSHPLTYERFFHESGDYKFAEVPLNDRSAYCGGFARGIVVQWDRVTRGLSDRTGQMEHLAFGATYSDTDRFWRGLLDSGTPFLTNRSVQEYMIDDEYRRLEGEPRLIANGFVSNYEPTSPLQFRKHCTDFLRRKYTRNRRTQLAWQPLIRSEDFDVNTTPKDLLDKPAPFPYGRFSDKDEQTVADSVHTTGYVEDLAGGDVVATVYGAPSSPTDRVYYVTALNDRYESNARRAWTDHRGETTGLRVVVTGAPSDEELRNQAAAGGAPATYVELAITSAHATDIRGYGRADGQQGGLSLAKNNGGGSFTLYDGKDLTSGDGQFLSPVSSTPPIKNNTYLAGTLTGGNVTTDTGSGRVKLPYTGIRHCPDGEYRDEFLVAACAVAGNFSLYLGGVRLSDDEIAAQGWVYPGSATWDTANASSDLWFEIFGRRYTPVWVPLGIGIERGLVSKDNLSQGDTPLTVNFDGIEDEGNGEGDVISNLALIAQHFVENAGVPSRPINAQAWVGDDPGEFAFEPGLTFVDRDSIAAVAAGTDIAGAIILGFNGEEVGFEDGLARMILSLDAEIFINRWGQLAMSSEPAAAPDVDDVTQINDRVNILDGQFAIVDQVQSDFANIHPYKYGRDYSGRTSPGTAIVGGNRIVLPDTDGWASTLLGEREVSDSASITNYDQEIAAAEIQLHGIPPEGTGDAAYVMARRLARYANPLRVVTLEGPLSLTSLEPGDVFACSHIEGIGETGWTNKLLRCRRHELDPNTNTARLEAYDLSRVLDAR